MRVITSLAFLTALVTSTAWAGQAENIKKCAEVANSVGVSIDLYQVRYTSNFLQHDLAEWRDVRCEVKLEKIYNLTVGGKEIIYRGFGGREAYELNVWLEKEIDNATETLITRADLLKSIKRSSEEKLRMPSVDPRVVEREVLSNVRRALSTPPDRPLSSESSSLNGKPIATLESSGSITLSNSKPQAHELMSDQGYPLSIPSDPKADYFVLEKGEWEGMPTLLTKRVGTSGTIYSLRVFDCLAATTKYLGTGESIAAMRDSRSDLAMYPLVEGSIAYHQWQHACKR